MEFSAHLRRLSAYAKKHGQTSPEVLASMLGVELFVQESVKRRHVPFSADWPSSPLDRERERATSSPRKSTDISPSNVCPSAPTGAYALRGQNPRYDDIPAHESLRIHGVLIGLARKY